MAKRKREQMSQDKEDGAEKEDAGQPSSGTRKRQHVQLPWMKVPAAYGASEQVKIGDVAGMKSKLRASLSATGYATFFPVQAVAWELLGGGLSTKHDLCINAPTGSGKTLAYALPVLQRCLALPRVNGLRALIVVPTRVLAKQVHSVISSLAVHLPKLSVVLANGSTPPAAEAALLTGSPAGSPLLALLPAVTRLAAPALAAAPTARSADIAVMTPGRLVQHLETLGPVWRESLDIVARWGRGLLRRQNALWLQVVDEADRLLRQAYHGWLAALRAALPAPGSGAARRVLRILVSATLTRNPSKLARFDLHSPRYIEIGHATAPADPAGGPQGGLQEFQIVTAAHSKPQALVALLCELRAAAARAGGVRAIVFASGVDVTRRLATLLLGCRGHLGLQVHELSSRVPAKEQAAVLEGLGGTTDWVLVSSDGMTRGMDVPGVSAVVNYDMPAHERTYAHRAGRTARAGRGGQVFTILRTEHAAPFAAMLRGSGRAMPQPYRLGAEVWAGAREAAAAALDAVRAAEAQTAATPA